MADVDRYIRERVFHQLEFTKIVAYSSTWTTTDGVRSVKTSGSVHTAAFGPAGKYLCVGAQDGSVIFMIFAPL